jgi:hypothetical protein
MAKSPEYRAYTDAKGRCNNQNTHNYAAYGGRGIQFKFKSFNAFYAEVGARPSSEYSIDRIDNNGNYEPGNIKWSTGSEQTLNRRPYEKPWIAINNKSKAKQYLVTLPNGDTEIISNMSQFCQDHGLSKSNLHSTIKHSWTHHGYSAKHLQENNHVSG